MSLAISISTFFDSFRFPALFAPVISAAFAASYPSSFPLRKAPATPD
jgi:hypothetical protein